MSLNGAFLEKVSILLPVYNAENYLPAALASLLLQDHEDIEIIAINDGSSDGSGRILQAAATQDPRVVVIERENRGLIATLNEGIARASGDFIARMDADDIAYASRISTQLRAFAADPDLALSGCYFDTLFTDQRLLPQGVPDATETHELRVLSRFCTILRHPTVMFRRSAMPEGMLHYDEAYPCAEDFDLFRRIAAGCKVAQTNEPLLAYRLHDNSVSVTRAATMVRSHVMIVEEELRRHYPAAAGTGFARIADEVTPETVARAADLIRRLDQLESAQPATEQRAYRMGVVNTFYFLFSVICTAGSYGLGCRFIEQTGHWDMIRRRERPVLRAAKRSVVAGKMGYAVLKAELDARRLLGSRRIEEVVPAHAAITARAKRIALPTRKKARADV